MKVLDPQSALLTTAEVHQFLQDNHPRNPDKKIGSYPTVNLHNYQIVRSDLANYTTINHPRLRSYPPVETFMGSLLAQLKPYHLTKAEVFALIDLGVGVLQPKLEDENGDSTEPDDETTEDQQESELSRSLFRLVVEESEQRFEGETGESQIDEILAILKESVQGKVDLDTPMTNGNHGRNSRKSNGVAKAKS